MGQKTVVTDVRIEISPDLGRFSSLIYNTKERRIAALEDAAADMLEQIKRHVDGAKWAEIVKDRAIVCEHCCAAWTEEGDYNGGCCDADEANNPADEKSAA